MTLTNTTLKHASTPLATIGSLGVLLSVLASPAGAQDQGVSVTDYEEATSAFEDAFVNGTLNANRRRDDAQVGYDLNLSFDYDRVVSSPERDIRFRAAGDGSVTRAGTEGADTLDAYSIGAGITADNYFAPSGLGFWYGSLNAQANSAFDSEQISAIAGVGYGRVRNVTPMAKSIRIVEELQSRGQLTATPSLAVYQAVARVIDREEEYQSRHGFEDYEQFWVADIAAAFRSAGLTRENFGAAEILKIDDILTEERISVRRVGWKVRAGLGYVFRNFDGTDSSDPALELGAEYHYPFSNRAQFSNEAGLTTLVGDGNNSYSLRNLMTFTYEIDDRIDWENGWTLSYINDDPTDRETIVNTLSTAFIYSLSNRLDATTTLAVSDFQGDETLGNPNGADTSLFVGVRYRLK